MLRFKLILTQAFGVIMIISGIIHLIQPSIYTPFFPDPYWAYVIVYSSGVIEIIVGLLTLTKKYRKIGATLIFYLMILFLPLHVLDVFSNKPVLINHTIALIRLPLQFVFIAWGWFISNG